MPKQIFFDAAIFCQVALKAQWQDAVLRRETIGPDGKLLMPPGFGEDIGYCPTFLMADEAQLSATPRDAEFKAVCRSKRASMWEPDPVPQLHQEHLRPPRRPRTPQPTSRTR